MDKLLEWCKKQGFTILPAVFNNTQKRHAKKKKRLLWDKIDTIRRRLEKIFAHLAGMPIAGKQLIADVHDAFCNLERECREACGCRICCGKKRKATNKKKKQT